MKRYAVIDHSTGLTHALFEELGEAIADAVKLQDAGKQVGIHDTQGSAAVHASMFDVKDAEFYLGRKLGSEQMTHPLSMPEIFKIAEETKPDKQKYHWDF